MPAPAKLEKATFKEISWSADGTVKDGAAAPVSVQFNPQTLKLSHSSQSAGGDQSAGSSIQFVGEGTSKLSFELWFDRTRAPNGEPARFDEEPDGDVRDLTGPLRAFLKPAARTNTKKEQVTAPPGVRFQWGSFTFEGVMDSIEETLEFFSPDGRPQRATLAVSLTKQQLAEHTAGEGRGPLGGGAPAGTSPLNAIRAGESLQQMAAKAGTSKWQAIAAANGIENPRVITSGTLIDMGRRRLGR